MTRLERFNKLNRSFKKVYVFHLGAEMGFYSEFNNMVSAMLYCLKYEYQFVLYSRDANFAFKEGWRDYFLPFCDETKSLIHHLFNKRLRPPQVRKIHYPLWIAYRFIFKRKFFTYELWDKFYSEEFEKEYFDIQELGINGDLREASAEIVKMIYRFNDKTLIQVNELKEGLQLPDSYISMQIRRGDKNKEWPFVPLNVYFEKAEAETTNRNLFVLADDYSIIEEINQDYTGWKVYTLTDFNERGYYHNEFIKLPVNERRRRLLKLFTSIEIIRNSSLFIGTFTANTGSFLALSIPLSKIISVQNNKWIQFSFNDNQD